MISLARHFRSRCAYAAFCFLGIITTQAQAQVYNIKEHIFIPALLCLRLHRYCKQCLRLIEKTNRSKKKVNTSTRIKTFFFLLRDTVASANSRLKCQAEINVDASTCTNETQFYSIEIGHRLAPRVPLLPL